MINIFSNLISWIKKSPKDKEVLDKKTEIKEEVKDEKEISSKFSKIDVNKIVDVIVDTRLLQEIDVFSLEIYKAVKDLPKSFREDTVSTTTGELEKVVFILKEMRMKIVVNSPYHLSNRNVIVYKNDDVLSITPSSRYKLAKAMYYAIKFQDSNNQRQITTDFINLNKDK